LVAVIGSGPVAIVEPEAVFAAAERGWTMFILQKTCFDAELRQDFPPPVSCTLDRVVAHCQGRLDCDFA